MSTAPASAAAPKKSRVELRGEQRATNPELVERFERYQRELKLSKDDADVLTGDLALARYFDAARAVHSKAAPVARWLLNDLLGLTKEADLAALPLDGAAFGRFVALVDGGRVATSAGKTLLASLVERAGDPEARMKELKLERVDDPAAVKGAIDRVVAAHGPEVERYRGGETKLLGVLLGAAMRETQGAADAATVRKALMEALGGA